MAKASKTSFGQKFRGWLRANLWNALLALLGTVFGGVITFLADDVDAWMRYLIQPGNLGGQYLLKSFAHRADSPYDKIDLLYNVDLNHGGSRVFGTIRGITARYKFNGYVRQQFLSFAYGGVGPLGTGTYTMQRDVEGGFWGFAVQVECIQRNAQYVRCPALMYKAGHANMEKTYSDFLNRDCEKVTVERPPDMCVK